MGERHLATAHLETIVCWSREGCAIRFAVEAEFLRVAREHGTAFCCPRGHRLSFGQSELDLARQQVAEEKARREQAEARERTALNEAKSARHASKIVRGKLKAVRERVSNGVCPCCNRSFINLQRHMSTKHPDYRTQEV